MFKGDGQYPLDGGGALELLWLSERWRELRNCPGRYSLRSGFGGRSKMLRTVEPLTVVASLASSPPPAVHACFPGVEGRRDPIEVVRFADGGGLLTYVKREEEATVYVHTLNTESGLIRKFDALGLDYQQMVPRDAYAERGVVFASLFRILTFLLDAEKNASAQVLVHWMGVLS